MAWWLVAVLLFATIPVAGADLGCTALTSTSACANATLPNGTDTNATNVNATVALAATSISASATPYGVFVVARGELVDPVSGLGIYVAPSDAPGDWACIFYAAGGGSSCQTPQKLVDALANSTGAGSYQNLIINATQMISCTVRTRVCTLPLG